MKKKQDALVLLSCLHITLIQKTDAKFDLLSHPHK